MTLFSKLFYLGMAHTAMGYFIPVMYNNFIMFISFKMILAYSKCQIYIKARINTLDLDQYPVLKYLSNIYNGVDTGEDVEVVSGGKCFYKTTSRLVCDNPPTCYDFMIYSADMSNSRKIDKILYYTIPTSFLYLPCTYSFISINITIHSPVKNNTYKLELSDHKFNFYVANNRINRDFIYYLVFNQCGILYDSTPYTYTMDIIDQHVNMFSVSEKDEIMFEENMYQVRPYIASSTINLLSCNISSIVQLPSDLEMDGDDESSDITRVVENIEISNPITECGNGVVCNGVVCNGIACNNESRSGSDTDNEYITIKSDKDKFMDVLKLYKSQ